MGFDAQSLAAALRHHLIDNLETLASEGPLGGPVSGVKVSVTGPMTGANGQVWNMKSVWGIPNSGGVNFITAFRVKL